MESNECQDEVSPAGGAAAAADESRKDVICTYDLILQWAKACGAMACLP